MKEKKYSEVVIIGAGFAGLWALKTMAGKGVRITVIDRNNYHTFLPLLYQVAAAEIEPEQIAYPVRSLMRGFSACRYVRAEVEHVDYTEKYVLCNGRRIYYDYLVAAPGSVTSYYGVKGAAINSFSLKTLDQAVILRNHILSCFERASYEDDPAVKKGLLSFVVIGGGPTGVEFAGALAELIRKPLRRDFPDLRSMASLYLVEAGERILSVFNEKSSAYALKKLTSMGVQVLLKSSVKEITPFSVTLD
ncbi:MAG TPA: FAD-dependent oxidoreductase, partial [Spirochaetota bacterium]|nr:FAD-dependent oxidoreductase [Spirochaetota bacterium]